jgi:prepilin-type N-terminal cleavage/methylation domain-containing protein
MSKVEIRHSKFDIRHSRSGFTLIEMLLVLAISFILMGLMLPAALNQYRATLVDDAARSLMDSLRRTRTQAVADVHSAAHGLKIMSASSSFILFEGASYATRNQAADEIVEYPSTVTLQATTTEVTFSRLYGTSTFSGDWTMNYLDWSRQVSLNSYGTVDLR